MNIVTRFEELARMSVDRLSCEAAESLDEDDMPTDLTRYHLIDALLRHEFPGQVVQLQFGDGELCPIFCEVDGED